MIEFHLEVLPPRYWAKVRIEETGCWIWTGAKNRKGYGRVSLGGRSEGTTGAHSWMAHLAHGAKPSDKHMVLHSCDTPACVQPRHLRWGVAAENSAEMVERGRSTRKSECVNRHALTPDNRYAWGACKRCAREKAAARRQEARAA